MDDRITTDPKVLAGKPVIRGTRIPVYPIVELLAAGNTREEILKEYPQLTDKDITAAMEYASGLLRGELLDARRGGLLRSSRTAPRLASPIRVSRTYSPSPRTVFSNSRTVSSIRLI